MTQDETRRAEALFRALERDEEQYMKAARAIHEKKMQPSEMILLWDQLARAHRTWIESLATDAPAHSDQP